MLNKLKQNALVNLYDGFIYFILMFILFSDKVNDSSPL